MLTATDDMFNTRLHQTTTQSGPTVPVLGCGGVCCVFCGSESALITQKTENVLFNYDNKCYSTNVCNLLDELNNNLKFESTPFLPSLNPGYLDLLVVPQLADQGEQPDAGGLPDVGVLAGDVPGQHRVQDPGHHVVALHI